MYNYNRQQLDVIVDLSAPAPPSRRLGHVRVKGKSQVVTVHEAAEAFTGEVRKEMVAAPTIAVFSDGNEDIATGYLRSAGIPQSSGAEFPSSKCGTANCGPSTANPDMLTEEAIMGPLGTCAAPNLDHHNGALFKAETIAAVGVPDLRLFVRGDEVEVHRLG